MERSEMMRVAFLTRRGCANSSTLYDRLVAALQRRRVEIEIVVVDVDSLRPDDRRTGYGTPTVRIDGEDLFGRATPEPAAPT